MSTTTTANGATEHATSADALGDQIAALLSTLTPEALAAIGAKITAPVQKARAEVRAVEKAKADLDANLTALLSLTDALRETADMIEGSLTDDGVNPHALLAAKRRFWDGGGKHIYKINAVLRAYGITDKSADD